MLPKPSTGLKNRVLRRCHRSSAACRSTSSVGGMVRSRCAHSRASRPGGAQQGSSRNHASSRLSAQCACAAGCGVITARPASYACRRAAWRAFGEIEVGHAVVDQVDTLAVEAARRSRLSVRGVDDHGAPAVALEQPLVQQELRIQVLVARIVVHDGDRPSGGAPRARSTRRRKPAAIGVASSSSATLPAAGISQRFRHAIAARGSGPGQLQVDEQAARIGVDLDELRLRAAQVEVETEHPAGSGCRGRAIAGACCVDLVAGRRGSRARG